MRYLPLRPVYLAAVLAALLLTAGLIPSAARVVSGQDSTTPTPNPSGFVGELVVEGLDWGVTDFAFAPDGRIFVTTLAGFVVVIKDGVRLPKPFIQLPVNSLTERGLIGLALDPSFQTNGYVYLFYTYEHDPSDHEGPKTNRVVRGTAEGDVAFPGSEVIRLGTVVGEPSRPSCSDFPAGAGCLPPAGKSHPAGGAPCGSGPPSLHLLLQSLQLAWSRPTFPPHHHRVVVPARSAYSHSASLGRR